MEKISLTEMRKNPLYLSSIILHGNGKLLDYDNAETGEKIRYAQFNTRAVIDCPFRSSGCEAVCYATKGNHVFPSVKHSREKSFTDSKRTDFAEAMVYTLHVEKQSKRYKDATMLVRIHESGDFYSLQYLKKWVKVFGWYNQEQEGIKFVLYTKSFAFFNKLSTAEKWFVNHALQSGVLSVNLSLDDTTTKEQRERYLECITTFPLMNTYYCTEHVENVEHNNVCDCADCAKCGKCNHGTGEKTVVKIHSASNADMEVYRKNINGSGN